MAFGKMTLDKEANSGENRHLAARLQLKRAIEYKNSQKFESAISCLDEALKIDENYLDALLIKALILGRTGRCSESIKCYDKILQANPQSINAWHLKAATYVMINQFAQAVECDQKAAQLDPSNPEIQQSLAASLCKLKRFDEAIAYYQQTIAQQPDDPQIHYLIGIALGNKEDYSQSLCSFERALQIKPDFVNALIGKGIVLTKLGRTEEAKACAQQVLMMQPQPQKDTGTFDPLQTNFKKSCETQKTPY